MQDKIYIKGARENNLKNIDLEIPRDKLVVITGLSGSGKSSLAFDTIYAEGQRRYVESLSSYARMFLGQMDKPDVDYIDGLSPAISIDQKTTSKNPRSTVGTVTEIYDYLRLLWARVGVPHCPKCGKEIRRQTIDQIVDRIMELPQGTRIQVLSPVVRSRKGEHAKVFEDAKKAGYVRVRVDGIAYELSEEIKLEKNKKHNIEIVVDRLVIKPDLSRRLTDSAETAMALSGGLLYIDLVSTGEQLSFSQNYACDDCGISLEELEPRLFSFNNPHGACPTCTGLGVQLLVDPELIVPNPELSIAEGGIVASGWMLGAFQLENEVVRLLLSMIVGGVFAGIAGVLIGIPVLRLRGDYLAIVTLAFGEIIRNVLNCVYVSTDAGRLYFGFNNPSLPGKLIVNGPQGAQGLSRISTFTMGFCLIIFTLIVVLNLINSRSGRAMMALRDNRIAAESVGISVTKYKLMAFVTSAVLAGMAGTLFGMNFSTFTASKFKFDTSILVLVFVVLGGIGNIRGSVIAAALLTILPELLRSFNDYRMLVYAVVLIVVMLATNSERSKQWLAVIKSRLSREEKGEAER
mgnify:CR=1 FL=1